jgi:hypothetical protein
MRALRLLVPVLSLLISFTSWATNTIDQQTGSAVLAFSNTGGAQTFQPSASNISGAGVFLGDLPSNVDIAVWTDLPNLGGTMLARATLPGIGAAGWNDVFWSPVSVVKDATYFLIFGGGIGGNDNNGRLQANLNEYTRGIAYGNSSVAAGYSEFATYDITSRTFSEIPAVPESGTAPLLMVGLIVLSGLYANRKTHTD